MVTTPTQSFYMNAINLADDLQSGKIKNLEEAKESFDREIDEED